MTAFPNFFLIGASKAGTTSLYAYLGQHPDVFMSPVKEPNYFAFAGQVMAFRGPEDAERINRNTITSLDAYRALFDGVAGEKAVGEASHWYLYHPDAAERIRAMVPHAKLIALLRDPVERAYSAYFHMRRSGRETLPDLRAAVAAEPERIAAGWAWGRYVQRGRYFEQLKRYYDRFPAGQIFVALYEDFRADPVGVTRQVYRFLGVDDDFEPDTRIRYNPSGVPRRRWLEKLLSPGIGRVPSLRRLVPDALYRAKLSLQARNLERPPLSEAERRQLRALFADDVEKLEALIGRDLSHWR